MWVPSVPWGDWTEGVKELCCGARERNHRCVLLRVLWFITASLVQHVRYRRKTRTRDIFREDLLQSYLPLGSLSRLAVSRSCLGKASALLGNSVALQFSIIIILKSQQGLLCIKPKTRTTTRVGVKENVGLHGIPPSVGSLCASVCYFRWSPELDDVNICKLLPPFFLTIKSVLLLLTINQ